MAQQADDGDQLLLALAGVSDQYTMPLVNGRIMWRAVVDSPTDQERLTSARAYGCRLVAAWWSTLAAADGQAAPLRAFLEEFALGPLPESLAALADVLGRAAARLDVESASYQIGLVYSGMLPRTYRASRGVYYTPPALTARLLDQATAAGVDWRRCRVLDPACGGGAFLAPVARRMLQELKGQSAAALVKNIATRLHGYEIDPFAAWLSQVTLDALVLPITRTSGQRLPVVVTVCDSLRLSAPYERFDLVIGNPPYGRVRLHASDRQRFKRSLYGHANLYGLFTDLALRHVNSDGVIAYVTPTSFLAGEYFKNLRNLLGNEAPPATIDFLAFRKGVFEDVLQETLVATYRKTRDNQPTTVTEIRPLDDGGLEVKPIGTFILPADASRPWLLARSPEQAPLVAKLARMPHRLIDWGYTVSTGPLVWNRYKGQLAERPGRQRFPLIWAEAVTSDGCFIWRAQKKNHLPYFQVRSGDGWLVTDRPCVLLQRTTAKEQLRRLIAAALPENFLTQHGAVVIENHLNMLRPTTANPAVAAEVLAAFLNSAAADRAFRCVSGSVAVSAYELEALPLPAPQELDDLARLIRLRAAKDHIEAACARLYDGVM